MESPIGVSVAVCQFHMVAHCFSVLWTVTRPLLDKAFHVEKMQQCHYRILDQAWAGTMSVWVNVVIVHTSVFARTHLWGGTDHSWGGRGGVRDNRSSVSVQPLIVEPS